MTVTIHEGDSRAILATLPATSARCCVTSPPYFGVRDYGNAAQIGLEKTPDAYVAEMVALFREVRRVLTDDGTLWLNLGDSYANDGKWGGSSGGKHVTALHGDTNVGRGKRETGAKPKDLLGIPWRVAFALQADGWYLRSDIIWSKPNPMPESVTDRPTKAHEYVFLLSKAPRYFYDAAAIAEDAKPESAARYGYAFGGAKNAALLASDQVHTRPIGMREQDGTRNARTVWDIATQPFKGSHFATMPPALAERCIKAGSAIGDTILDPFGGAGTTGLVADRLGRHATLIELNPTYAAMARERITLDAPLLTEVA